MGEVARSRYRSISNGTPVDTRRAVARRITPGTIFDGKSEQDANCEVPVATGQQQSPTGSVRLSRSEDSNRMCCQRQTKIRHSGSSKIRYFGREFLPQCLVPGLSAQHRRHDGISRRSTVCSTLDMESQISSSISQLRVGTELPCTVPFPPVKRRASDGSRCGTSRLFATGRRIREPSCSNSTWRSARDHCGSR